MGSEEWDALDSDMPEIKKVCKFYDNYRIN